MYLDNGFDCSLNAIRVGHGMDVVGIGLPQVQDICILPQHLHTVSEHCDELASSQAFATCSLIACSV